MARGEEARCRGLGREGGLPRSVLLVEERGLETVICLRDGLPALSPDIWSGPQGAPFHRVGFGSGVQVPPVHLGLHI